VEAVALGRGRVEQPEIDEGLQDAVGLGPRGAQQRGGGVRRDAGGLRYGQQPERAGRPRVELVVAQPEGGLDREIADPQLGQPAVPVRQPGGQRPDRPAGPGRQPGGGDPYRQREEAAQRDRVDHGAPLGRRPTAHDPGEQRDRLDRIEHVQIHRTDAVQPGRAGPRGHQDRAALRPGQQRADLVGVACVVEQDQHAPVGEQRPEQRGPLVLPFRYGRAGDAERAQEPAQDHGRLQRALARALEVDVELPVGMGVAHRVGDVHGQGGLADAADA
jgi:hypothetical protein